jgi:hypothetical protein
MRKNKSILKKTPKKAVLRGKGDYSSEIMNITDPMRRLEGKIDHLEKSLVKNPLSKGGAAKSVGRLLGGLVGQGDLGEFAGSSLAKLFGHGDYHVSSNSLIKNTSGISGAKFVNDGSRGTRIIEREFIGNIASGPVSVGSSIFELQSYILNPTNSHAFPWLSQVAHLYDQWEPHGIVFEFISTSSEFNGTTQALGAVIMATDYDPYDPLYANKQQMENADYSCSSKPSLGLVHGIECDPRERPLKILYTSQSNGAPVNTYSLGTFQLATQGCSAQVTLGELWISYDITFYKKQLETQTISSLGYYHASGISSAFQGLLYEPITLSSNVVTINSTTLYSIVRMNNVESSKKYLFVYWMDLFPIIGQSIIPTNEFNCFINQNLNSDPDLVIADKYMFSFVVHTTGINATFRLPLYNTAGISWKWYFTQLDNSFV